MRGSAALRALGQPQSRWRVFAGSAIGRRMNQNVVADILKRTEDWPDADRAELAAYAQVIAARRDGIYLVSDDERAAIEQGLSDLRAGDVATEAELAASAAQRRR
ncbi:MAG: hypothetical protein Q8Q62_19800 [Mesorhizobium sp.]|nr:hypothetical protein [Mesorhizobium sp.]